MTSQKQINANRKNAKKSTGPKTPEGKAKSAQNATTHGLTASSDVIKTESQEQFDAHKQGFLDALSPRNAVEDFLAEHLASLAWRLKRAKRIQNQVFNCMLADHNFDTVGHIMKRYTSMWAEVRAYPSTQDPNLNLGAVVRRDYQDENVLHRLLVYERRIENSFFKSLHELQRRTRKNPSDPILNPDHDSVIPTHPCHPELDSGSQHPGKEPTCTHPPGTQQKKQTQSPEPQNTATSMESELYNLCSHVLRTHNKPNHNPPGTAQNAPRSAHRSGTRRY